MRRTLVFLYWVLLPAGSLMSQCPDNESTWKRLIYLWDNSATISSEEQLYELKGYEASFDNCQNKVDSTYSFLLLRIGAAYYRKTDYIHALQYAERSIDVLQQNIFKPTVNPRHLVSAYYYLSVMYDAVNKVTEKMKSLDSCAEIAIRLNAIDLYSLSAMYTRVEFYFDIGDYHRCLSYASKCEQLALSFAKNGDPVDYNDGMLYATDCFDYRIAVLIKLKDYDLAEMRLLKKIQSIKGTKQENNLGTLYDQLAGIHILKGNDKAALANYNLALEYDSRHKIDFGCKMTWDRIGYSLYFTHLKDTKKALAAYKKALSFVNHDERLHDADVAETINLYTNIAVVYTTERQFDSAFSYFQRAFDQIRPGMNEETLLTTSLDEFIKTKKLNYLTGLLIDKGNAFKEKFRYKKNQSDLVKSIKVYKAADRLFNKIRAELKEMRSKVFWRNEMNRLYEQAIEACYLAGNKEDAFYFFEKSKAVLLNDQLSAKKYMNDRDIIKEAQLRKKILNAENELLKPNLSAVITDSLRNEIFFVSRELDKLINVIKESNPVYYQDFLDSNFITLGDVRSALLKEQNSIVEFFSGDSALYIMTITEKQTSLRKINKPLYDSIAGAFIGYVSDAGLLNRDYDKFVSVSRHLYKLLFETDVLPPGRIIVSPDGMYFPFEALITNQLTTPYYFLYDYAVSYTYSVRFLMTSFERNNDNSKNIFLGIAPVQFAGQLALAPLMESDLSLNRISGYMKGIKQMTGTAASKENFLREYYKYKIIHLYTHASETSARLDPVLYFSDSAIYLSELVNENKLLSRLIVISACESGSGKLYRGEGIFSFNRAFAALGIPSAITNLWSVDNKATYEINELFYKNISKGQSMDVALQKAKIEFIKASGKEKQLPYFWAATVLQGKTDAIMPVTGFRWTSALRGVIVISVLALMWVVVRRIVAKTKRS